MNNILIKALLLISFLLFLDYIIMVLIGCTACILGFTENFYMGTFSGIGKFILFVSAIFLFLALYPDLKAIIFKNLNSNRT